jgi:large subunit ribosomal protein L29
MSKIADIRELTDTELVGKKAELRQEYLNLRLQQASGQLEKPHRLREIRREVARVETALSEKSKGLKITSRKPAVKK